MRGFVGEPLLLEVQLASEQAGLFPWVTIRDEVGLVVVGFGFSDRGTGLYQSEWLAPIAGQFTASFLTFSDAAFTIRTNDEVGVEDVRIDNKAVENDLIASAVWNKQKSLHVSAGSFGEAVIASAGHAGLHAVLDGGVGVPIVPHNGNNNLISSRLRIFQSKADADVAILGAANGVDGELLRLFFDSANYIAGIPTASVETLASFRRSSS